MNLQGNKGKLKIMKNNILSAFLIIIFITITSCQALSAIYHTFIIIDSASERLDKEDQIYIYIDNKTNETLVLYVSGYNTGVELARISQREVKEIKITKGRTIYISGGNSQINYLMISCDNEGELFTIR